MVFLHLKTQELPGASPPGPHQGLCPWTPQGPLSGPLDPTPQGSRALGASIFCTVRNFLNQWGTQPSLALGHPQAKLRHCTAQYFANNTVQKTCQNEV